MALEGEEQAIRLQPRSLRSSERRKITVGRGAANGGKAGPKLIHAVYMNNESARNQVRNNRFDTVSGDVVRVSNGSNDNQIRGNTTHNAGNKALVSAWHNEGDPNAMQLPSTGGAP